MVATPIRAALSRAAGRMARARWSRLLIPWFARHYRVAPDSYSVPLHGFSCLQEFFCRPLAPGLRPVAAGADVLTSPADGVLGGCGPVDAAGQLFQAKGHRYTLSALLGDPAAAAAYVGGCYCTIYLAPSDYHRVHAPEAGLVREARYIPGSYFPVNPSAVARVPALFAANERLVSYLDTSAGRVAVVMVGACLVGGIRVNYDPGWNAASRRRHASHRQYNPPEAFARGQELGRFEFGSTVILLAPRARLLVSAGARVQVGQAIAETGNSPA
ncbi:MAG: archaetidylserine decarboxylase [Terriglobales bacterium]